MSWRRPAPSFLPATAVLELTYACSHRCIFCSCPWDAPHGGLQRGRELDLETWKGAITTLTGLGVTSLAFTGGEPTLKAGWKDLVAHAASCDALYVEGQSGELVERRGPPELTFLSNGRNLGPADFEVLARHGAALSISLPGLETFAEHTGGGDPLRALTAIQAGKAAGLRVTAGVTVTRLNLGELEETLSAALLAGADFVLLNRFLPGGRGLGHMDLLLDPDQVRAMLQVAEATLARAGAQGTAGTEIPACVFDPALLTHLSVGTGCAAARTFFVVGPNGAIRVCNHSPEEVGSLLDLPAVAAHPTWRRFALGDHVPPACRSCASAGPCAGGCREAARILTGEVDGPDGLVEACGKTFTSRGSG